MTGASSDDETNAVSPDETIAWIRSNLSRIEQFFTAAKRSIRVSNSLISQRPLQQSTSAHHRSEAAAERRPGAGGERAFIMRLYLTRRAPGCQCSHCGTSGVTGSVKSSRSDASRAHVALRRADGQRRHRITGRRLSSRTPAQLCRPRCEGCRAAFAFSVEPSPGPLKRPHGLVGSLVRARTGCAP